MVDGLHGPVGSANAFDAAWPLQLDKKEGSLTMSSQQGAVKHLEGDWYTALLCVTPQCSRPSPALYAV